MKTKKMFSKVFALLLAAVMMFAMSTTVFAGTITITKSAAGQSYKAWKVFDVTTTTITKDDGSTDTAYAYTLPSNSALYKTINAVDGVTLTLSADGSVYKVEMTDSQQVAKELADALLALENSDKTALVVGSTSIAPDGTGTVQTGETSATISVDKAGYYFIDSSLGALCFLNTAADSQTIAEKNGVPDIDKEITGVTGDSTSLSVGDTVSFKITVTAGGAADTSYVVHDKMTAGLDLTSDTMKIQVNGVDVSKSNYTVNYKPADEDTFDITFNQTYTASLDKDAKIVITYDATLNSTAVTRDEETNTTSLDYGNSSSTKEKVTVYNYDFDLVKTDNKKTVLTGAQFKLYSDKACTKQVKVTEQTDGSYIVNPDGSADAVIKAGKVTVKGLAAGKYYLVETKAPDGYNALTEAKEVEITNADLDATVSETTYTSGGVQVVNNAGSVLPTTGGIGTTIFYVIGSVMVAGALVLLVVKKRMSNYQD